MLFKIIFFCVFARFWCKNEEKGGIKACFWCLFQNTGKHKNGFLVSKLVYFIKNHLEIGPKNVNFYQCLTQNLAETWEKHGKIYFDQHVECVSPKHSSKYTTVLFSNHISLDNLFISSHTALKTAQMVAFFFFACAEGHLC